MPRTSSSLVTSAATSVRNFGGKTPFLTTPAYIMLVAYVIMGVTIMLPFELKVYDEKDETFKVIEYNFAHRLLLILYLLIPVCLHIYSVNCMIVGNCTLWSYVFTFIHILWILVFIVIAFSYAFSRRP
jgi:hypothetical protein